MSGEEKRNKKVEEIAKFAETLMGGIDDIDEYDLEDLYQEFSHGKDPASAVRELALKAAQKHRLANRPVPLHVQLALDATGQAELDSIKPSKLKTIVDQILRPTHAAVHITAPSYRNKKDITPRDKEIVKELSDELEQSWEEGDSE
jgi:hypothetical protein